MKEYIKNTLYTFCLINTGSMLGAALFISIFYSSEIKYDNILWRIAIISLLISIINTALFSKDKLSKKEFIIRIILHYILVNVVVIGSAYIFKWINNSMSQIISLIIIILAVYVFVFLSTYQSDKQAAEKLNEKISEYNKKE